MTPIEKRILRNQVHTHTILAALVTELNNKKLIDGFKVAELSEKHANRIIKDLQIEGEPDELR